MEIRSLQNPRIKAAARLRDRRGRQQQRRIIVDGAREVTQALLSGCRPIELFVDSQWVDRWKHDPALDPLRRAIDGRALDPTIVASAVFRKLAYGQRDPGAVLVAHQPPTGIDQLNVPADALVCVLEGVEKPGNLGAVLRTADAAGVQAVCVAGAGTDLFNPNVIRASLGAVFRVPLAACPPETLLHWLRSHQYRLLAARVDGDHRYSAVDWSGPVAILLGSESAGLSDIWTGPDITPIVLPMLGSVDSLNVAATAAVLCYEALRQRQAAGPPD